MSIPVYSLQERGKDALEIRKLEHADHNDSELFCAHRDENYVIVYQQRGESTIVVDFKEVTITAQSIFVILPGQVHYGISVDDAQAWMVAVDSSWIQESFRAVFMDGVFEKAPISLDFNTVSLLNSSLELLNEFYHGTALFFQEQSLRSALDISLAIVASIYKLHEQKFSNKHLRIHIITGQFKSLLALSFRVMKSPSDYAKSLNISASYLNDAVKDTTGHSMSYWIHQEIMLEAKRMLFYTDSSVKEVAHILGYEDPTYFIRLFGKVTGTSPNSFRQKYRK